MFITLHQSSSSFAVGNCGVGSSQQLDLAKLLSPPSRPQFLPEHWDVNYQEEVFAVKEPSQCRQPVSLLEFGLEDLPKRLQRQIPTIPDKS